VVASAGGWGSPDNGANDEQKGQDVWSKQEPKKEMTAQDGGVWGAEQNTK